MHSRPHCGPGLVCSRLNPCRSHPERGRREKSRFATNRAAESPLREFIPLIAKDRPELESDLANGIRSASSASIRSVAAAPEQAFDAAWERVELPIRRSLQLAYASLTAGGLACGAVLTDQSGTIVAEGRNRAYDPPGGDDVLQGTPLAHAETNVLARVSTDRDLAMCTLWSTQEPCSMCTAAAAFTGIGSIRYVAPDPWAIAADQSRSTRSVERVEAAVGPRIIGPAEDDRWVVSANVIFMLSIGRPRGPDHPTIARNAELEPETTAIVRDLLADRSVRLSASVEAFLRPSWALIVVAAASRAARVASR